MFRVIKYIISKIFRWLPLVIIIVNIFVLSTSITILWNIQRERTLEIQAEQTEIQERQATIINRLNQQRQEINDNHTVIHEQFDNIEDDMKYISKTLQEMRLLKPKPPT